VQRHFAPAEEVVIPAGEGGHGGGDEILLRDVFRGPSDDGLGRVASWPDGVRAVAVGLAGNRSLESGLPVRIAELDLGAGARALGASDIRDVRAGTVGA
jgi:hypothetical protein